ncbi:MAG: serine--tRNA ligase [Thermaerobacter sp.]|nr:serine--tRNA ligase [Thermaerobacter sp.]
MLDLKFIRAHPDRVAAAARAKGVPLDPEVILALDARRRELLVQTEALRNQRNVASEDIARRKREGQDAAAAIREMQRVAARIKAQEEELAGVERRLEELLVQVPNPPHPEVPVGEDEGSNQVVRHWGTPPQFPFAPQAHWDLGTRLGILDFERAGKVTGARFTFYRGAGALLERALVNFMVDLHVTEHGCTEIFPPFLANTASLFGTGQLPKLREEMFRVEGNDYFLIPTAEVPVTNLHRDEILRGEDLPLYYAAYSACFRAEAGAAGRDTRGLIRQHQFNKVELVKFVRPQNSYRELESLVTDAAAVLERLELPYRVVLLCTGDLSFASAKTYDLEVYLPSYQGYKEISSCSNFEDFQARRANIRFRPAGGGKAEHVHTLNGSGLAVGRTVAAILENHQQADGSVRIPAALRPYMRGMERIALPC